MNPTRPVRHPSRRALAWALGIQIFAHRNRGNWGGVERCAQLLALLSKSPGGLS